MKLSDDWVYPEDPTDVLPEGLRRSARRRRVLVRVGGVVVTALFVALLVLLEGGVFFGKVWFYGRMYREIFGP